LSVSTADLTTPERLPHENVYVRLGTSELHGIGVFACQPIVAGTNVFADDESDIRWVSAKLLEDKSMDEFQQSLYRDFAIRRGDEFGCPSTFNLLTVGWYVNEPRAGEMPNLTSTPEFELIAIRDIHAGEELTLCYSSFGKDPCQRRL
jgi:SET domain-containing protein